MARYYSCFTWGFAVSGRQLMIFMASVAGSQAHVAYLLTGTPQCVPASERKEARRADRVCHLPFGKRFTLGDKLDKLFYEWRTVSCSNTEEVRHLGEQVLSSLLFTNFTLHRSHVFLDPQGLLDDKQHNTFLSCDSEEMCRNWIVALRLQKVRRHFGFARW